MFEFIVGVLAIVAMVKIAYADDQSRLLWGAVTFGLIVRRRDLDHRHDCENPDDQFQHATPF